MGVVHPNRWIRDYHITAICLTNHKIIITNMKANDEVEIIKKKKKGFLTVRLLLDLTFARQQFNLTDIGYPMM